MLQSVTKVSYLYVWAGTSPVGVVTVEVSNDYSILPNGTVNATGTWVGIPFVNAAGATVTSFALTGNSGKGFLEVVTNAYAIRTVYTYTSGTGTLTVTVNGKIS